MKDLSEKAPVLWTKDFILAFLSNFLLFYSFYMLIPVLPVYLIEQMKTNNSVAGVVLALYTLSALFVRPFSGYLVDKFSRKPLYLICYGAFSILFAGYLLGAILTLFVILRILHGITFGLSTVSGSTVAVDIMTPTRRGEGIGYFGMAANLAMAIGPVTGLWIFHSYSINAVFLLTFITSLIGFFTIVLMKPIKKIQMPVSENKEPASLDRFILVKAIPCVALLFLSGLGYGAMLNYLGLYTDQASFKASAGAFFSIFAVGIVLARILSAKPINRGQIVSMIYIGGAILSLTFCLFIFCNNSVMFYSIAFLLGIGFGYISPSFQTMLINLARHDQRGTANATYFTFWDLGIGIGTMIGGFILDNLSFSWMFGICMTGLILGTAFFMLISAHYFEKNKLR